MGLNHVTAASSPPSRSLDVCFPAVEVLIVFGEFGNSFGFKSSVLCSTEWSSGDMSFNTAEPRGDRAENAAAPLVLWCHMLPGFNSTFIQLRLAETLGTALSGTWVHTQGGEEKTDKGPCSDEEKKSIHKDCPVDLHPRCLQVSVWWW